MTWGPRLPSVALLSGVLLATGCGYKPASQQRRDLGIATLSIMPLENRSTTFEVEQILTRRLIQAFVQKTGFKLINEPAQADAVLTGTVNSVTANQVIFSASSLGSTFLVTLRAQVELRNRLTGQVIYRNDNYVFREQYQINSDVKNFFSEENPALSRIADDFAGAVVSAVMESF